jgi:tRNA modification GTPase
MATHGTIAACATGMGAVGGAGGAGGAWGALRAIVRLSGPDVARVVAALCPELDAAPDAERDEELDEAGDARLSPRARAVRLRLGVVALPALAIRSRAPRSFTGEETLELLVPGAPEVVERVMRAVLAVPGASVRHAEAGEFSARAYLAGRLTLEQAEGLCAMIAASGADELAAARRLLASGDELAREARGWGEELSTLLALVEAGIDFGDTEGVVPIATRELARRIDALASRIGARAGGRRGGVRAGRLARVVLVGPPSAGKSTLFNALLGRRRAVVAPEPGTTRDALCEELLLGAASARHARVSLVDVAGLELVSDDAADPSDNASFDAPITAQAQRHALNELSRADVAIVCLACGVEAATRDAWNAMVQRTAPDGTPRVQVATMADRPHRREGAAVDGETTAVRARDAASTETRRAPIAVCALDGRNLGALREALLDAAWSLGRARASDDELSPRQRVALGRAMDRLDELRLLLRLDEGPDERAETSAGAVPMGSPELVAAGLRAAIDELAPIVGDVPRDEIIGRVFATFCIGK